MEFSEFKLDERLMQGLEDLHYTLCTKVQEEVLKAAMDGSNLYVQSQTGTGKTLAYLLPIMERMLYCMKEAKDSASTRGKALIMLPTRELAEQVTQEAISCARHTPLKAASFYGGVGYEKQLSALKSGVDIIIGTPGRMIDLNEGHNLDLSMVEYLVIDEADRMFDMGFYPDLRTLLKVLPSAEKRQTMLFSATLNTYVKNLAWEFTRDAKEITIDSKNITVDQIDQELLHVSSDDKMKVLLGILLSEKPESVLIFCNTKRSAEVVAKRLVINGIKSAFIIGDMMQKARQNTLDNFKAGNIKVLLATDVAARGIDVENLAMVINYDTPNEAENYVHRIGRTARAGKSGKAYTLCSEQDVYNLPAIERYIGMQIPSKVADDKIMASDKSKDVYIKTEDWGVSNAGFESGKGGKGIKQGEKGRYTQGKSKKRLEAHSERVKKPIEKRYGARKSKIEYTNVNTRKRDGVPIKADKTSEALQAMPFDERMKFYKEKYAKSTMQGKEKDAVKSTIRSKDNKEAKGIQKKPSLQNKKKKAGKKKCLFYKRKRARYIKRRQRRSRYFGGFGLFSVRKRGGNKMSIGRVLLCILLPPLAVLDKGCGSILIVSILTCAGWVPGAIAALVICNKGEK